MRRFSKQLMMSVRVCFSSKQEADGIDTVTYRNILNPRDYSQKRIFILYPKSVQGGSK